MRCARLLPSVLALGALGLAACGDDTTEPSSVAQPNPTAPELAITRDSWITRAAPPVPRVRLFTATVPNAAGQSVVYAIGGRSDDYTSTKRVDAYNVVTYRWRRRADMPTPLRDQTGSVLNGKIYVAGGSTGRNVQTAFLYTYDPVSNTWIRKRDMPAPGTGGASGVIHGKLYVLTSYSFFRYNPATDSWVRLPAPPSGLYEAGAVLYDKFYAVGLGGKMYVIGVQLLNPDEPPFAKRQVVTWLYNPFSDTWSERTAAPGSAYTASKVYVNGKPQIESIYGGSNLQYIP